MGHIFFYTCTCICIRHRLSIMHIFYTLFGTENANFKKNPKLDFNDVQSDLRWTNCPLFDGTWWYSTGAFLSNSKLNIEILVSAIIIQHFIMRKNIMSISLCQYWRSLYWPIKGYKMIKLQNDQVHVQWSIRCKYCGR